MTGSLKGEWRTTSVAELPYRSCGVNSWMIGDFFLNKLYPLQDKLLSLTSLWQQFLILMQSERGRQCHEYQGVAINYDLRFGSSPDVPKTKSLMDKLLSWLNG
jgi:hypothetical protein